MPNDIHHGPAVSKSAQRNDWRILILLGFGTIIVRCLMIRAIWPGDILRHGGDGIQYYAYAMDVLHKPDWLTTHLGIVPPLYPLFLAAVYGVCGESTANATYAQTVFAGLTSVLIYLIGRTVFRKRAVGILAACWFAVYPLAAYQNARLMRETLILLLVALVVYLLLSLREKLKMGRVIGMSAAYTALIHVDPRFLFYGPFIILFIVTRYRFRLAGWKNAGICFLTVALLSVPWLVRNYVTYNEIILIDTRVLRSICMQSRAAKFHGGDTPTNKVIADRYRTEEERALGLPVGRTKRQPELTYADYDKHRAEVDEATDTIGKRVRLKWKNAWWVLTEFWRVYRFRDQQRPWPDRRTAHTWSLSHNLASIATFGPLLLLTPLGAYWCFRRHRAAAWILVSPLVLHTLLHLTQGARCRYRLPIAPLLMLLSAFTVVSILEKIRSRSSRTGSIVADSCR